MGFFDEYVISVGGATSNIHDDEFTSHQTSAGGLCYSHEPYINNRLWKNIMKTTAAKLPQIRRYGIEKYTYGLPQGTMFNTSISDDEALINAIENDVGGEIEIFSAGLGQPIDMFFVEAHAHDNWGFDYDLGYMTDAPVTPIGDHKPKLLDALIKNDKLMIAAISTDSYQTDIWGWKNREIRGSVYNPNPKSMYYQVRYMRVSYDAEGNKVYGGKRYWIYRVGTNRIPELEDISTDENSLFMPIVPMRLHNQNLGPEMDGDDFARDENGLKILPDTELYRTSRHLIKIMGLDFDDLCYAINTNPDIGDIDHAYIMFGINIRTETKEGKRYVYQFFKDLGENGQSALRITDAQYDATINFSSINIYNKTGVKPDETQLTYSGDTLIIDHKTGENTYDRIVVDGLKHRNLIYDGEADETPLSKTHEEDFKSKFILPLNYDLARKDRALFRRQDLVRESLIIAYNSYEKTKLKWYQTSLFQAIMFVVGVVLTIVTLGQFLPVIIAAYNAGISALVVLALKVAITMYGMELALTWVAEEFGVEVAIFVSIFTIIFTLSVPSLFAGAPPDLLSAETLISVTSGLGKAVQIISKVGVEMIQDEFNDFEKLQEEQNAELKELQDLIHDLPWITPEMITSREHLDFHGESPDDFYNRTTHTGNVGTLVYGIIPTYHDTKLTLPELNKLT